MNREEQLKQAIEEAFPEKTIHGEPTTFVRERRVSEIVLSTPSILRHANHEIMKAAGWVKIEDVKQVMKEELKQILITLDGDAYSAALNAHHGKPFIKQELRIKKAYEAIEQAGWVREDEEVKPLIDAILNIEPLNTGDYGNGACCPFCKADCSKWNDEDLSNTKHSESCVYLLAKAITEPTPKP